MFKRAQDIVLKTTSKLILESMEDYSAIIDEIVEYAAEKYGLTFDLFVPDLDAFGRCHYDKKLIEINVPTAKDAMMTLAHEIGHWVGYLKNNKRPQNDFTKEEREGWAKDNGWKIIQKFDTNQTVTKEEWDKFNII